jgi:hypothetical protein
MNTINHKDISILLQFVLVYKESNIYWNNVFNRDAAYKRLEAAGLVTANKDNQVESTELGKQLVDHLMKAAGQLIPNLTIE